MSVKTPLGTIWYVSKYVAPPGPSRAEGGRGYELMRELAALGHEVRIFTSNSNHLADVPDFPGSHWWHSVDGLHVCWVRTMQFSKVHSARRALSWLHFEWRMVRLPLKEYAPPDAVVVSSLSLFSVFTGLNFRRRYGSRLVFEVRDIWPLTLTEEGGYSLKNPLIRALAAVERLGYRCADAVVGTMPNLSAHVRASLGRTRPTYCIPMGFSDSAVSLPSSLPAGYADAFVPEEGFIVGYAGTIGSTNALETFLAAARGMQGGDIRFLVVGAGDLRDELMEATCDLDNVTFAEPLPKRSVQAILAECDVLYFGTHDSKVWEYGQSLNKLIDYMLAGKYVVGSYSGYPSMLNEAQSGTFVPAGDADSLIAELKRLMATDHEELTAWGARGRDWLMKHRSYASLARDYEQVLFGELA